METQTTLFGKPTNQNVGESIAGIKAGKRIKSYYDQLIRNIREERERKIFPIGQSNGWNKEKPGERERFCYDSQATTLKARDYKGGGNLIQIGRISAIGKNRVNETPKEINEFLRSYKSNFSNQQIANELDLPLTKIEHYFRTDSSRAIPNKKTWFNLKELLDFPNTWDKAVCEIEEKEYYFGSSMRVYDSEGLGKTLSANGGGMGAKTGLYMIGNVNPSGSGQSGNVYSTDGITPTINAHGGGLGAKTGLYAVGCAFRSYPRTKNPEQDKIIGRFQKLEKRKDEISNQLTTVQKDSMIEITSHSPRTNNPKLGGSGPLRSTEHCFTIDRTPHLVNRIRRLTPIECERLQGFPDNWTEGLSDTQRYKCMGNAVTTNVVTEIGKKLLD